MTIATLRIAGSDLCITRVGFGCARILGGREAAATARLIEAALRVGIRHFDTAPSYGDGASETLLGDVLAGVPDVTIATKVGAPPPVAVPASLPRQAYRRLVRPVLAHLPAVKRALVAAAARSAAAAPPPVVALSSDAVRRSLDRSERNLRRRVDLLLLHEPDQLTLAADVAALFDRFKAQGRIAAFGGGTGGTLAADWSFGTVRQQRFGPATGPGTAILHGVLRGAGPLSPRDRLAQALAARPDAAFLFSASAPAQIAQLVGA